MIDERLQKIADHYGANVQKIKLIEEMAELTQAICKGDEMHIAEEIADVEIMLEQVKYLTKLTPMVEMQRGFKINRQLKRIGSEV